MAQEQLKFCFCTLALGQNYCALALDLAQDLDKYSPGTQFIVLTDRPQEFSRQSNVLAFRHKPQSVKFYHDKRFVLEKALSLTDACIFIDADMRILAPIPQTMEWLAVPGIAARACKTMLRKHSEAVAGQARDQDYKEYKVTEKVAQKLDLKLEDESVKHIQEYLFSVTKDSGRESEFLSQWGIIAPYFELSGLYAAEGNAIGLAAAKAGLQVRWSDMEGISFFKERIEVVRAKEGKSNPSEMAAYLERQRVLEYPKRSVLGKVAAKLNKNLGFFYRSMRLRVLALGDFNFYYR